MMDGAEIVTGKAGRKKETLLEGGRFRQQTSLADLQQFAQIDQSDRDESPKFEPVQESSAYPHEMPPSAREMLPPGDGDSNPPPPPVRGSSDD